MKRLIKTRPRRFKSRRAPITQHDLRMMEERIVMKLDEVKAVVAEAASNNKEAFSELSTKIADMQKQIDDLIAGAGNDDITDEVFLANLESLRASAASLAAIIPNVPPVEPPVEPS